MKAFLLVALALLTAAEGQTAVRFEFADRPRLVNCEATATIAVPCFRVKLNAVDEHGAPTASSLPATEDLTDLLQITIDGIPVKPFYAVATQRGHAAQVNGRIAMLVIDISGSMKKPAGNGQSRFEAAKAAALEFLNSFQPGIDRVAIVPFGSRNVERTIRQAPFANTVNEARQQIESLPRPSPEANTALYSAISFAVDAITAEMNRAARAEEAVVIVMTDGKNDIGPRDDPGLLKGDEGLRAAVAKVKSSGLPVVTIGFGDPAEVDQMALQQLGTRSYMVDDPAQLKAKFAVARSLQMDRIVATAGSPYGDLASLAGRSLRIRAGMTLPSGERIQSPEAIWTAPQMAAPAFEGKCDEAEIRAALARGIGEGSRANMLRPVLVFLGIAGVLALLWFALPALLWPDAYGRNFAAARQRWSAGSGTAAPQTRAPPGFGGRGMPERRPDDPTVYRPRTDFGTRTRLNQGGQ